MTTRFSLGMTGAAVLVSFAGGAVLWRAAHPDGAAARAAPAAPPASATIVPDAAAAPAGPGAPLLPPATPGSADASSRVSVRAAAPPAVSASQAATAPDGAPGPEDGPSGRNRPPRAGTERWYLDHFRGQAAEDPAAFAAMARERLTDAGAPLAEKTSLLRAARDADPALADALYAAALDADRTRDPALRAAAAQSLLRDIRRPRPDPAAWDRLSAFALGGRRAPGDPVRLRAAAPLYAAAPENRLDRLALDAERDPDAGFLREAWRGLLQNPTPRARDLADDLARRHPELGDPAGAVGGPETPPDGGGAE